MPIDVKNLPLVRYLKELNEERYHQLISLRSEAETWLRYVPQTFPHFTDHTVRHCDAIVQQLGLILVDDVSDEPVVKMSSVELHMLLAAAYLHDSGMVVPDSEKESILASDEWNQWKASAGKQAWETLEHFRNGTEPADAELRNFKADVQLRAMLATFVRKHHAARSQAHVHRFVESRLLGSGHSPQFWAGVAELCAGHGLSTVELADSRRFPLDMTVDSEPVAFRWLAILLRLGDLLDMSTSRSCATLQLAAGALPAESQPHWTQYSRIAPMHITPSHIVLHAACETPDEHRLLLDWFRWIHEETHSARPLLAGQQRHSNWNAPWASLDPPDPTLIVEPGSSAQYIAHDWKLELDTSEILNRLVRNTYPTLSAVLRELLQNAADALRCCVSDRLIAQEQAPPADIRDVSESILDDYAIEVRVRNMTATDDTLAKDKQFVELSVTDNGPGMSVDTIQRYLLQAGRSYYQSEEFTGRHQFPASSRFGIGFLSVLGVSNHVVVTTRPRDNDEGIRLTLTAPENYLLVERVPDAPIGTTVALRLSESVESGWLRETVKDLCHKLEFVVRIEDFGQVETVVPEDSTNHEVEVGDVSEIGARLAIRSRKFTADGADGAVYFFVRVGPDGQEDYSRLSWAQYRLPSEFPNAQVPSLPASVVSVNGLVVGGSRRLRDVVEGTSVHVDVRKPLAIDDLQRTRIGEGLDHLLVNAVASEVGRHLHEHLEERGSLANHDWRYVQALGRQYGLPFKWFDAQMQAIEGSGAGQRRFFGIRELSGMDQLRSYSAFGRGSKLRDFEALSESCECLLHESEIAQLPPAWRKAIFENRTCTALEDVPGIGVVATWARPDQRLLARVHGGISVVDFPDGMRGCLGLDVHKTTNQTYTHVVFNRGTALGTWIERVAQADVLNADLPQRRINVALEKLDNMVRYPRLGDVREFLERLREASWLPQTLLAARPGARARRTSPVPAGARIDSESLIIVRPLLHGRRCRHLVRQEAELQRVGEG